MHRNSPKVALLALPQRFLTIRAFFLIGKLGEESPICRLQWRRGSDGRTSQQWTKITAAGCPS